MFLHLGQDTVIRTDQIIGVFDLDNTTVSVHSRTFLTRAQKAGRVKTVSYELPKSFVVCLEADGQETVYLSQLSTQTLLGRYKSIG
jgi:extracellular matrix regulatory protein B